MNRQQLNHINNRYHQKLQTLFKRVAADPSAENNHNFRVEYKRLRAFLRMLSLSNKAKGKIKISKAIQKAYHISGSIRDLQLLQKRITKMVHGKSAKPQPYLKELHKLSAKLKPGLSEVFSKKLVSKNKAKTTALIPEKFLLTGFKSFAREKWAGILSIVNSGNFSDTNMHMVRKNLKDIFYNLELYKGVEHDKLFLSIAKGKNEKYFDHLMTDLGNFQDHCVAVSLLRSNPPIHLAEQNAGWLEMVKKEWQKEKTGIKRLLVKQLKADFAQ